MTKKIPERVMREYYEHFAKFYDIHDETLGNDCRCRHCRAAHLPALLVRPAQA